jgi:hypothetical protein
MTFRYVYERNDIHLEDDEVWLPSGKRASVDDKLRYFFPPGTEVVQIVDEVLQNDPLKLGKRRPGMVKLRLEDKVFSVANNQPFEEAILRGKSEIQAIFLSLPNGVSVEITNPFEKQITIPKLYHSRHTLHTFWNQWISLARALKAAMIRNLKVLRRHSDHLVPARESEASRIRAVYGFPALSDISHSSVIVFLNAYAQCGL